MERVDNLSDKLLEMWILAWVQAVVLTPSGTCVVLDMALLSFMCT